MTANEVDEARIPATAGARFRFPGFVFAPLVLGCLVPGSLSCGTSSLSSNPESDVQTDDVESPDARGSDGTGLDVDESTSLARSVSREAVVGAAFHAIEHDGVSFEHFLRSYGDPSIRAEVRRQLQALADHGATHVSTRLWYSLAQDNPITLGPPYQPDWLDRLETYLRDVQSIRSRTGAPLRVHLVALYIAPSFGSLGSGGKQGKVKRIDIVDGSVRVTTHRAHGLLSSDRIRFIHPLGTIGSHRDRARGVITYQNAAQFQKSRLHETAVYTIDVITPSAFILRGIDGRLLSVQSGASFPDESTAPSYLNGLGWKNQSPAAYLAEYTAAYRGMVDRAALVRLDDGRPLVDRFYIDGEFITTSMDDPVHIFVPAEVNNWWVKDSGFYQGFVDYVRAHGRGIEPSVYFQDALPWAHSDGLGEWNAVREPQPNWKDPYFDVLDGHRNVFWTYRTVRFLRGNGLFVPSRIDVSLYPDAPTKLQGFAQDFEAVMPNLTGDPNIAWSSSESGFFEGRKGEEMLDAFAALLTSAGRFEGVIFWSPSWDDPVNGGASTERGAATFPLCLLNARCLVLSSNRPSVASKTLAGSLPGYAVDGDLATNWNSGGFAPQSLTIDLGAPRNIYGLSLVVNMTPTIGNVTHRVWGRGSSGQEVLLKTFSGTVRHNQILQHRRPSPFVDVRSLRVETTESPSWISWKEVRALGLDP